jgi:hypothetical protein
MRQPRIKYHAARLQHANRQRNDRKISIEMEDVIPRASRDTDVAAPPFDTRDRVIEKNARAPYHRFRVHRSHHLAVARHEAKLLRALNLFGCVLRLCDGLHADVPRIRGVETFHEVIRQNLRWFIDCAHLRNKLGISFVAAAFGNLVEDLGELVPEIR